MKSPSLKRLPLTSGTTMQVEDDLPDGGNNRPVKVFVLDGADCNERLEVARSQVGLLVVGS